MKVKKSRKFLFLENTVVLLALIGNIFYPPKSMVNKISMAGIGVYLLAQAGLRMRRLVGKKAEETTD